MPKKKKKTVRTTHYIEYIGIRVMQGLFGILPLGFLYFTAEVLGRFVFHVLRIRRTVTLDNLKRAFGDEYSSEALRKIAARAYVNMGKTFLEMLVIERFIARAGEVVDFPDAHVLTDSLKRGKGIILISGHIGSWEINGVSVAATGVPVSAMVRRQSNPLVDRLVTATREKVGIRVIYHGAGVKKIVRALRENEVIGLVSDQDAGKKGVFVDFFGRKTSTPQGAARLALKYEAPLMAIITVRTGDGYYRNILKDVPYEAGDTIESLTQRYTKVLEETIRRYPDQYFWMHRRWKTAPPPGGQALLMEVKTDLAGRTGCIVGTDKRE